MKRIMGLISILWFCINLSGYGQDKDTKNLAGFSVEYFPYLSNGIYFNDPFDFFPNSEPSYMYQVLYARQLTESFRVGTYLETGSNNFTDQSNTGKRSFRRNSVGFNWLGQYPKTKLHFQLGGYFGYAMIKANNWDNLQGVDFGLITGPAFETRHLGAAIHLQAGFSPYKSTGTPEGILLYTPRILFKIYGRF
jgi:hypothetical protein